MRRRDETQKNREAKRNTVHRVHVGADDGGVEGDVAAEPSPQGDILAGLDGGELGHQQDI